MKSTKDFREANGRFGSEDMRRGTRLTPVKKSGKERYSLYAEEDDELLSLPKRESVFDYFDDADEDM